MEVELMEYQVKNQLLRDCKVRIEFAPEPNKDLEETVTELLLESFSSRPVTELLL
jgi:hypothetical protein